MVVCKAAQKISDLPEGDEGYQIVARRIKSFVRGGRLIAQGDIARWRYSEVRLRDENCQNDSPK